MKTQDLQTLAALTIRLERVGPVEGVESFNAYLVPYRHACLRWYALVARRPLTRGDAKPQHAWLSVGQGEERD